MEVILVVVVVLIESSALLASCCNGGGLARLSLKGGGVLVRVRVLPLLRSLTGGMLVLLTGTLDACNLLELLG